MKNKVVNSAARPAVLLTGVFLFVNLISFFYTLMTHRHNGDFWGVPVNQAWFELTFFLIVTSLPFIFLHSVLWFKLPGIKLRSFRSYTLPIRWVGIGLLALHGCNTIVFGVGKYGYYSSDQEGIVRLLVILINRFPPSYLSVCLILLFPKSTRFDLFIAFICVAIDFLRGGIGSLLYLSLAAVLKYQVEIILFTKKRFWFVFTMLLLCFFLVKPLYGFRATLRGIDSESQIEYMERAPGLLVGRVSSFTNTLLVHEKIDYRLDSLLEDSYAQRQLLSSFLGRSFLPAEASQIMFARRAGNLNDRVSYMTGTIGECLIAFRKSYIFGILIILQITVVLALTRAIFSMLKFQNSKLVAHLLLVYPVMSGVASEFGTVLSFSFFFLLLILLINLTCDFFVKSVNLVDYQ